MSTGTSLLTRALRMLGALASGATPDTNQQADGLISINGLLESWRNDRLLVYATVDNALTMISAQQSYTVGTGGDLNIVRPVGFEDAFMTQSGVDSRVKLVDQEFWDGIPNKLVTGPIVEYAFYNPTMATGTLKVYPVPNAANVLHLITWNVLASLAAIGTTFTLPPGWDRMIASHLAIEISPEYGIEPSQALVKIARDSMAAVKRANITPIIAYSELAALINRPMSRILNGP